VSSDWRAALRETGAAPAREAGSGKRQAGSGKREAGTDEHSPPAPTPAATKAKAPAAPAATPPLSFDVPSGLVVGTPAGELFGGPMASLDSIAAVAAHIASCTRCPLYSTAKNHVPGEGNPNADLMCVGEAPGATEDELGRPFVGASGQLLTKILAAVNLAREDVFIANVLKHRPPGNRNPLPEEVKACSPYLIRQIELIRPKVIIAWGTFAAQTLLDTKLSIGKLRGQIHRYYGVPLIVTYHPAALLRNPSWKRPTWEDVQLARRILDSASPGA
jgi:DNA polymerase